MAQTLNVTYAGPPEQHLKVSLTPMSKLQAILDQACPKLKPAANPAACELVLHEGRNKRALDLQIPFRFANIPTSANAKLEIIKVANAVGAGPSSSARPAAAASSSEPCSSAAAAPPQEQQQQAGGSGSAEPAPSTPWQALGLSREVAVFTKDALDAVMRTAAEASGAAGSASDPPDDFYEFTPEDLAAITRANEARKKDDAQLKTRALREAAERARAEAYGPIPVRLHFPDNTIVQAAFGALEPLSTLQELASQLVVSELSKPGCFYLYTTPPKQVLRDLSLSLFKAQLVPAAHVYFHVAEGKVPGGFSGPFLKQPVLELCQSTLDPKAALPGQAAFMSVASESQGPGAEEAGNEVAVDAGSAASTKAEDPPAKAAKFTAAGSKVPKWMKLG